jgi:hypothetical protein
MGQVSVGHALLPRPAVRLAAWLIGVAAAFTAYVRLARTWPVNSDGAGNALQAWDMLHGNVALHGWWLSDVSFCTTELPQYMLMELVRGLNADVVHVAAAMTYTLAILLAALLAKSASTGREAVLRVLVAAGIMLAPQLDSGVNVLLSSPDHIGTSVPVMVAWLILDRARPGWYVAAIAAAVLGWAAVADTLVLYIGVLPLVLVCAVRVYRAVVVERAPLASQWFELALGTAAAVAGAVAELALPVIHALGGFFVSAPTTQFASGATIVHHNLGVAAEGLLLLGGADFLGRRPAPVTAVALLHVLGVVVAAWAVWRAARRFLGTDLSLVDQVLTAAILINLAAYVLSTHAQTLPGTRQIAAVLPFSAALAGRLLARRLTARRLTAARLVPVLAAVLAGYLAGLGYEISQPAVPAQNQQLVSWLAARHLRTGLSGYWEANVVTLASGDRIQIRAVSPARDGRLAPYAWESDAAWYDPRRASANFVVLFAGRPAYPGFTDNSAVRATFGPPARTYEVGPYSVLAWNRNLLSELGPARRGRAEPGRPRKPDRIPEVRVLAKS